MIKSRIQGPETQVLAYEPQIEYTFLTLEFIFKKLVIKANIFNVGYLIYNLTQEQRVYFFKFSIWDAGHYFPNHNFYKMGKMKLNFKF